MQIIAALILGCSALQLVFVFADAAELPPYYMSDDNVLLESVGGGPGYQGARASTTSDSAVRPPPWVTDAKTQFYGCCSPVIASTSLIRPVVGGRGDVNIIVDWGPRHQGERACTTNDFGFTYVATNHRRIRM